MLAQFYSMKSSFRKQPSLNLPASTPAPEVYPFVIGDLEQTIDGHAHLGGDLNCRCDLCEQGSQQGREPADGNLFRTNSRESSYWLKKILDGLCLSGARTLKFHLPDIIFLQGDNLQIFQTNRKDGRLIKLTNSVSLRSMYPTAVRLRKEYKNILEQTFNEKMLEQIDPQFMHIKYFDKFVPPYFHDGRGTAILRSNKARFRRYILHKNKKYEIQQIEEHKMNEKEPFCLVKYTDGNCQLFNQREFEVYSLSLPAKLTQELVYVQSYIKYKLESDAIYYSQYTLTPNAIDHQLDDRAERQILVLIGGVGQFEVGHKDVETYDELCHEMMVGEPRKYVQLMTYKIVHYLSMTSRIYIDHIKIKWIMNDIGHVYLQEVMEFAYSDVPRKLIKYRLPPKDQALEFIHESHNFVQLYKELKRRKTINTQIIKKTIQGKSYEEMLHLIDPQAKPSPRSSFHLHNHSLYSNNQSNQNKPEEPTNSNKVACLLLKEGEEEQKTQKSVQKAVQAKKKKVKDRRGELRNSVTLDKWRNVGQSERKQRISSKINRYFTIKVSDEVNSACKVMQKPLKSRSTGKCRLRYALQADEPEIYDTISTFRPFKRTEQSARRSIAA